MILCYMTRERSSSDPIYLSIYPSIYMLGKGESETETEVFFTVQLASFIQLINQGKVKKARRGASTIGR